MGLRSSDACAHVGVNTSVLPGRAQVLYVYKDGQVVARNDAQTPKVWNLTVPVVAGSRYLLVQEAATGDPYGGFRGHPGLRCAAAGQCWGLHVVCCKSVWLSLHGLSRGLAAASGCCNVDGRQWPALRICMRVVRGGLRAVLACPVRVGHEHVPSRRAG